MAAGLPERATADSHSYVLKACPKCLGDLVLQHDLSGDYYVCLQCGTELEPRVRSAPSRRSR